MTEGPKSAAELISTRQAPLPSKAHQRGELLKYFAEKLGKEVAFIAFKVTGLSLADLYYLKSISDAYEKEGKGEWGKAFNGALK